MRIRVRRLVSLKCIFIDYNGRETVSDKRGEIIPRKQSFWENDDKNTFIVDYGKYQSCIFI